MGIAVAVSASDSTAGRAGNEPGDPVVDSIYIENRNIYDADSAHYDFWLFQLANKLHIKTKKYVIKRELLLRKGDVFSRDLAEESARNLRALPFLWEARARLVKTPSGRNILHVTTADSWTLLGGISLNRSAGETVYHVRAEEQNFLGTGQYLSFHYYFRDTLEDYGQFTYLERRLLGSRYYFQAYHDGNPEIGMTSFSLGLPFYSLNSQFSGRFDYIDRDRRRDYYENGRIIAQHKEEGSQFVFNGAYRFGTYNNKVRLGIELAYKDMEIVDKIYLGGHDRVTLPDDSLLYAVIPKMGIHNYQYVQATHIDNFRKIEDILFLNGAEMRIGRYFDRDGDKLYDYTGFTANFSKYYKGNMFFLKFSRNYWINGGRHFRKGTNVSIRYYNNNTLWLTPILYVSYDNNWREDNTASLYLGENNGLRGYPRNYTTGDKRIKGNIEYRFFPGIEILSADVGAVHFWDFGKAWKRDSDLKLEDILWSVGFGLRIGLERISHAKILRFDLAYAGQIKDWQLSFGLGQYIKQ